MTKAIDVVHAVEMIPDGASLLVGGFLSVGSPRRIIDEIVRQEKKRLTLIANDTSKPGIGIALLIESKCVDFLIASNISANPETQRQMASGELRVELCPEGTLAERIRAGGYGLGGVLTPVGVGTMAAEDKSVVKINNKDYILEMPIRADFALLGAHRVDFRGNLDYALMSRNLNPIMAYAGDVVIAEANEIVPVGVIPPDGVMTPHVLVDYMIERRRSHGR
ncbi:MAG: 3-oxoacid CoA-transferase subunit A [Bdellovibrionales bacterium]